MGNFAELLENSVDIEDGPCTLLPASAAVVSAGSFSVRYAKMPINQNDLWHCYVATPDRRRFGGIS